MHLILREGKISGLVFYGEGGILVVPGVMNKLLIQKLIRVKKEREDLVLCDLDQIWDLYNIGRSLRRGSQTRAREGGVPSSGVYLVNK